VTITALRDEAGRVSGFSKMTRDITERRRDEERLIESEQKFRAVLESAPDAMLMVDETGKIALVNAQTERLFGYLRDELVGQSVEILLPVQSRDYHTHLRSEWGKKPCPRPMSAGLVLKGLRRDGAEFPVEVSLSPIETGTSTWVVAAIRDVTERRIVELQLVGERRRAEEANRTKSAFLATMSHEIRTPMNAILGMSDLLWESDLNPEQREFVEIFRRAGANLLRLINHLLDLSKIEAGHFELEKQQFNLEDVLDQVSELFGGRARRKGIALLVRIAPDVATDFIGDPGRLRQALLNLVGNALKFTEKGEITVTAQSQQCGEQGKVSFAVSDTGIGIPADKLEVIFDDFTQADSSVTRKYGGTGLGLSITRRIVELMGGRIFATSTLGQGSTFVFTAVFEPVAADQRLVRREVDDFQGRRVLVVDDSCTSRLILRETLSSWGLVSDAFATASQALEELACAKDSQRPYSLAILDNRLSDMDCVQATAAIRKIEPAVPLIILSSGASECDTAWRALAGVCGFAVKPVKRSDMLRLVCQAMGGARDNEPSLPSAASTPLEQADRDNPLRILVAEDSPDNRVLVQAYLKGGAYSLTFVDDGQAAVDEFALHSFDLVLMDVQMPVMDGLTATRKIREFELSRPHRATPIVALTAHASQKDTEMSIRAGCDSHLSKPISKLKLVATIEKYGRPNRVSSPPAAPIPIHMPEGLEDLVPRYLSARREEIPELAKLLAIADFERLRSLAHNLKGSGLSFGFSDLTRLGAELENSSREADTAAVTGLLEQLGDYLNRVQLVS
jgi:PAS domain S-box-containing protein